MRPFGGCYNTRRASCRRRALALITACHGARGTCLAGATLPAERLIVCYLLHATAVPHPPAVYKDGKSLPSPCYVHIRQRASFVQDGNSPAVRGKFGHIFEYEVICRTCIHKRLDLRETLNRAKTATCYTGCCISAGDTVPKCAPRAPHLRLLGGCYSTRRASCH